MVNIVLLGGAYLRVQLLENVVAVITGHELGWQWVSMGESNARHPVTRMRW